MDGRWTRKYHGRRYIDGSFLSKKRHYLPIHLPQDDDLSDLVPTPISLDYWNPFLAAKREHGKFDFVKALSPKGIWSLLEQGMKDAKVMEEQGNFSSLSKGTETGGKGRRLSLESRNHHLQLNYSELH